MTNTTEMTGIHGRIYFSDGYVADGVVKKCDVSFDRTDVTVPPGAGGTAEKCLPGSMKNLAITCQSVLLTMNFFKAFFGGSPVLSSVEALLAETQVTGSVMEDIAASSDPTNPSIVKFTAGDGDTVIPDNEVVRICGTDSADNEITEELVLTTGAGTYYTTQVFKTVDHVEVSATYGNSGDTNKATVQMDANTGTTTVGASWATTFTFKFKVQDDAEAYYIEWTVPEAWIKSFKLASIGEEVVLMNDVEIRCKDTSAVTAVSTME